MSWFQQKKYGIGLEPANWKGWVATVAFIACMIVWMFLSGILDENVTDREVGVFIVGFVLLEVLFLVVAFKKSTGKMAWRWGNKKKRDSQELPDDYNPFIK